MIIVPVRPKEQIPVFSAPSLVFAEDADPTLKYTVSLSNGAVSVAFVGCKVVTIHGLNYLDLRSSSGFGVDHPLTVEFHDGVL